MLPTTGQLLPDGAVWLDGSPFCVWDCGVGYTRNTSVVSLEELRVSGTKGGGCVASV